MTESLLVRITNQKNNSYFEFFLFAHHWLKVGQIYSLIIKHLIGDNVIKHVYPVKIAHWGFSSLGVHPLPFHIYLNEPIKVVWAFNAFWPVATFIQRCSGQGQLRGDPWAAPGHVRGIKSSSWPGSARERWDLHGAVGEEQLIRTCNLKEQYVTTAHLKEYCGSNRKMEP